MLLFSSIECLVIWYASAKLYGVTFQKTVIIIVTSMRTSNLTTHLHCSVFPYSVHFFRDSVHIHTQPYESHGRKASSIVTFTIRCRRVVSFIRFSFYPRGKCPHFLRIRDHMSSRVAWMWYKRGKILSLLGIEPRVFQPLVRHLKG